jgi:hypothetical protein
MDGLERLQNLPGRSRLTPPEPLPGQGLGRTRQEA